LGRIFGQKIGNVSALGLEKKRLSIEEKEGEGGGELVFYKA